MTQDSPRSVTVERISTGHFVATNARGATITFGTSSGAHGDSAFTPVELLLAAIGGCSAADVDVATSRHAEPATFSVAVTGDKVSDELGNRMTGLRVAFSVTFPDGEGDGADRARTILPRAVRTSHDRLCTVSRTVEIGTPVTVTIEDS
ncbi:OsmC family protein [Streptomyces sp. NPDC006332]|uniref:OsmC family protein n=1 Tax=Streptomyces sp. NPDC006332 TaxID=3155456 RepID=UPI0033AD5B70